MNKEPVYGFMERFFRVHGCKLVCALLKASMSKLISYNACFLCENSHMGRTMKESNRQALLLLNDDEHYAAAHIAALGLEQGVWNDEPDPEQAAKTFRMNLAKIAAKLPDEPDGYRKYPRQERVAAWLGWRWKRYAQED